MSLLRKRQASPAQVIILGFLGLERFAEFYELQNHEALSVDRLEHMRRLFEEVDAL